MTRHDLCMNADREGSTVSFFEFDFLVMFYVVGNSRPPAPEREFINNMLFPPVVEEGRLLGTNNTVAVDCQEVGWECVAKAYGTELRRRCGGQFVSLRRD